MKNKEMQFSICANVIKHLNIDVKFTPSYVHRIMEETFHNNHFKNQSSFLESLSSIAMR